MSVHNILIIIKSECYIKWVFFKGASCSQLVVGIFLEDRYGRLPTTLLSSLFLLFIVGE